MQRSETPEFGSGGFVKAYLSQHFVKGEYHWSEHPADNKPLAHVIIHWKLAFGRGRSNSIAA